MLRYWSGLLLFVAIVISVFLGCVECRAQSETAETSSPVILPAGTPVILHLTKSLYKKDAKPGQAVEFEVGYDVLVNGQVFIQSGAAVSGKVRQVDHAGRSPAGVTIDLGAAQMVSEGMVRLAWRSSPSSTDQSGIADAVSWGAETGPLLPAVVIASLFEKKVILNKNAWGGVWGVAQAAENVALDPAKQKAGQERYTANKKAAQAKLCGMLVTPDFQSWESFESLVRRSGLGDQNEADLLHRAGDLGGAIEVYQQLLASKQDLPCSDKYAVPPSLAPWFFALSVPEQRAQLLKSFSVDLHRKLAELYREKLDFVHAISECRTAAQLAPEDEPTRIGLISTLQDSGDPDAAIAESKEAIRVWPDNAYFHYLLGRALIKKDPDAAIFELQWALKMTKNHFSPANCELGGAFEAKGDLQAAVRQYRTAFRAHVNDEHCRAAYERLQLQLKK
jgi:tetratricopeptide (TPR) repeat protein